MRDTDVEAVHAYQSRADVCRYLPYEPRTREEVAAKIAKHAAGLRLAGDGDYLILAVELEGQVIGDTYFSLTSVANATAEIGWVLHPDYEHRGYMKEAAGAILDLAFGTLRLHRVFARLDPRNEASGALCRRLGMREEAHLIEDTWFRGAWADTSIYGILDREWQSTS
jgi:RimJ/RimL family protein N-acetyltransferase